MLELAHAVTQMANGGDDDLDGQIDNAIDKKEAGLVGVLQMADDLRINTLKEVVEILTPMQSVHFLIAAAELHLRVHEWGKKRDEKNNNTNNHHHHHRRRGDGDQTTG